MAPALVSVGCDGNIRRNEVGVFIRLHDFKVPKFVEYLLVGAGTAAYYASLAIRARHADAKVLMVRLQISF